MGLLVVWCSSLWLGLFRIFVLYVTFWWSAFCRVGKNILVVHLYFIWRVENWNDGIEWRFSLFRTYGTPHGIQKLRITLIRTSRGTLWMPLIRFSGGWHRRSPFIYVGRIWLATHRVWTWVHSSLWYGSYVDVWLFTWMCHFF